MTSTDKPLHEASELTTTLAAPLAEGEAGHSPRSAPDVPKVALTIVVAVAAVSMIALALASLTWPRSWDSSIMEYVAWLINNGSSPYRDIFDMNFPGAYIFHAVGQRLFGPSDVSFRIRDVVILAAAMTVLYRVMRRFPWPTAPTAVVLVAIQYLVVGGAFGALQRDWLIGVCTLAALPMLLGRPRPWRLFVAGAILGAAISIRPTAAIMLIILPAAVFATDIFVLTDTADRDRQHAAQLLKSCATRFGIVLAGATASIAAALIWVVANGGWSEFSWIVSNYVGPYTLLDGAGSEVAGRFDSLRYVAQGAGHRIEIWLFVFSIPVVLLRRRPKAELQLVVVLMVLAAGGLAQAVASGKGWEYHYWTWMIGGLCILAVGTGDLFAARWRTWESIPRLLSPMASLAYLTLFVWWVIQFRILDMISASAFPLLVLAAPATSVAVLSAEDILRLIDSDSLTRDAARNRAVACVVVACIFLLASGAAIRSALSGSVAEQPAAESAIAEFLSERLGPDGRLQLLATVGGKEAALEVRAKPATPFIYDFHFFHDVGSPAITELRARFMRAWENDPPDFVVVYEGWNGAWGPRLTKEDFVKFPELSRKLEQYEPVFQSGNATVLERRTQN